ncbi:hypothetical protein BDV93DRAFT_611465 [Ceratobasidium sp. AG-I]|nr:hypothetical protein BDV93DRAFT_611465 [Ceratobasidium sp. AG-I]
MRTEPRVQPPESISEKLPRRASRVQHASLSRHYPISGAPVTSSLHTSRDHPPPPILLRYTSPPSVQEVGECSRAEPRVQPPESISEKPPRRASRVQRAVGQPLTPRPSSDLAQPPRSQPSLVHSYTQPALPTLSSSPPPSHQRCARNEFASRLPRSATTPSLARPHRRLRRTVKEERDPARAEPRVQPPGFISEELPRRASRVQHTAGKLLTPRPRSPETQRTARLPRL